MYRLSDIIGHRFTNSQLVADQFAKNGYFVMMPDLFHGDPVPLNKPGEFDMQKWRMGGYHAEGKAHLPADVDPIVETCIRDMRAKYNCKVRGVVESRKAIFVNNKLEAWSCGILFWRKVCRPTPTSWKV
jgi:dienelactone hydrolase